MTDIVQRLRSSAKQAGHSKEWDAYAWLEAADEIERLRSALKGLLDEWDKLTRYGSPMARAANERVNAARRALEQKGE